MRNSKIKTKKIFSFKQIKKDLRNKKELKKTFVFLIYFLLLFIIIYLFLNNFCYKYINYFYGFISNFFLSKLFLINTNFVFDNINNISIILLNSLNYPIFITSLCTGILEFSLISSAILASRGVKLKNRIIGFLLSIPLVVVFNIFRIVFTILILIYLSLSVAEFLHSFLFRLFLIIIVIVFYYFWFKFNYK
jgi:exosortase/archaeosortase family protein